mmetsp:Transcript_27343/g.80448  ORF Transcript_27343/g.80448 Transcript_27343/m.80448 type:complete len:125 (-) Transcript_27343:459-833(-)
MEDGGGPQGQGPDPRVLQNAPHGAARAPQHDVQAPHLIIEALKRRCKAKLSRLLHFKAVTQRLTNAERMRLRKRSKATQAAKDGAANDPPKGQQMEGLWNSRAGNVHTSSMCAVTTIDLRSVGP